MANYILDGLMARWGKQYEQLHKGEGDPDSTRVTLYDQLPKEFIRTELRELIAKLDLTSPDRIFIAK